MANNNSKENFISSGKSTTITFKTDKKTSELLRKYADLNSMRLSAYVNSLIQPTLEILQENSE